MPIEDDKKIREILSGSKTIAVVGASNKPLRDSHRIMQYLVREGYNVIPVNPMYTEIDGRKCYPDLASIGQPIDIVDVFRNPDTVGEIAAEAVEVKAKTIWFQLGVVNALAARKAEASGLQVIMDHCIAIDHSRLMF
ncbi:MAG: CoA-binding protein [Bacteroidetes bacterium]|nr:CoA-binding protein [Bacteroidota bacterium]